MEYDRRVQIRVDRLKGGRKVTGFGSGYLVAPRLVLTAAHVVDDADPTVTAPVRVSLPGAGENEFTATVRWRRQDGTVDAALIEIPESHEWRIPPSLGDLLTRPPQRYGLIIGHRPQPVIATGFPRLQKDSEDGRRLDEQLNGHIAPGTGALAGRYEISSIDPTPSTGTAGGTRWSGMSGASVLTEDGFSGDLLCGVVRRDRLADGGTRLTATTAASLLADSTFRALVTEHTGWEPVLEPIEPAHLLTPAAVERNFRSPAALLRADAEAVTFHGRDTDLANLKAWCENGPPSISIRVITGPGGQGKTRLARRLTDTLGRHGWVTGHLRSDLTDDPTLDGSPPDFTTLNTALPLLLVVDYAETRPRLLRRLITHLHLSRHRVRVLLLARSDGQWRTGSLQAVPAVRDLFEEAPVIPLAPLSPAGQPVGERQRAYHRAAADLARFLPLVPTLPTYDWVSLAARLRPPEDLHDLRYDNVLTLQMTALVSLLQHGPLPVEEVPGAPPERTLLKHEDRFWEASANAPTHRLDLDASTLGAAVAVAVLCGAATRDNALQVIASLPGLPAHQAEAIVDWLAMLYPAIGHNYWGSLHPDRVAEYHASHVLESGAISLPPLLGVGSPAQQAQTITVLARAAIAHYNSGRGSASDRVLQTLDAALDITPIAFQAIESVVSALPYPSSVTAALALELNGALTQKDRDRAARDAANKPNFAYSLNNLGVRLTEAGRHVDALEATGKAVEIYYELVATDPITYEPDLARALLNLGSNLSQVGRRQDSMIASANAVELYNRLAAANPDAYEPELATAASNLANRISAAGYPAEALTCEQQAVTIRRRLAAGNSAAYGHHLAHSLSNLGTHLSQAGFPEDALGAASEAVELWHELAAANPAAYEPDLARALSNLGSSLSNVGRQDDAVAATLQSVAIYRRLSAASPDAHEPSFATALSNLGNHLVTLRRPAEALAPTEHAVEIRRRLAANNPSVYEPALAGTLHVLAVVAAMRGDYPAALRATEEAANLYRRHIATSPGLDPQLQTTLHLEKQVIQAFAFQMHAEIMRPDNQEPRPSGSSD
ncbi:tetratricopeptide repeat protein [Kitasatospora sp. NPDC002040]|uniref:tetratricopeptide repeat protein n=1 Tax=Kitasatospora sp. NPDC002040 TaxID=3154661 RepID=UPI0033338E24